MNVQADLETCVRPFMQCLIFSAETLKNKITSLF